MNLVIQKLQEINEAIRNFDQKKMSVQRVHAFVALTNAAHKWASLALQAFAIESKNRRIFKELGKMNIIDSDTALDMGIHTSQDSVKCPIKSNDLIKREDCLDHSGGHIEDCRDCDQFSVGRERLI